MSSCCVVLCMFVCVFFTLAPPPNKAKLKQNNDALTGLVGSAILKLSLRGMISISLTGNIYMLLRVVVG